jgi:hypothetical protein
MRASLCGVILLFDLEVHFGLFYFFIFHSGHSQHKQVAIFVSSVVSSVVL